MPRLPGWPESRRGIKPLPHPRQAQRRLARRNGPDSFEAGRSSLPMDAAFVGSNPAHPMWNRNTLPAAALFAAVVSLGFAAENLDLERKTPVPADQPIPTQDFFRPLSLSQPVLNRAGTHIAAIVSAGEDKHMLMVYDIATAKIETLGS